MGVKATNWAWEQPLGGNEKVVLLALADWARDDGLCWPGQEAIATKSRISLRTAQSILKKLETGGYIIRERRGGEGDGRRPDLTRLAMGQHASSAGSPTRNPEGGNTQPTRTRERNRQREPSESPVRGRAVSYRGARVPAATVTAAETLLAVFNEVEGRDLGARTGTGHPSPSLRQIIGALMTRSHVTIAEWERAVRAVSANPPDWCDGQLQLGHIFGERAAEYALANTGVRRANGKKTGPGMSDFAQIAMGGGEA